MDPLVFYLQISLAVDNCYLLLPFSGMSGFSKRAGCSELRGIAEW
jgi:hypothetical protein